MIFISFEMVIVPMRLLEIINITKPIRNDNNNDVMNRFSLLINNKIANPINTKEEKTPC